MTVRPSLQEAPYSSAELLGGGTKRIERLAATSCVDAEGRMYLEIEAGTNGVGPTYRLYAAEQTDSELRRATGATSADALVLEPNTSIGLYDDWEDDIGVPWAQPLQPLHRLRS